MAHTTTVLLDNLCFGEGPRWHEGRLWFSDMHDHKVIALGLDGRAEVIVEVPQQPSGLGWTTDGTLLVVSMVDRRLLRLENGRLVEVADLSALASWHCNDMVVDAAGRAYIGNFGFDLHVENFQYRPAELILVEPDGRARVVADDLAFPNGTVITPDGRTLIVGESFGARFTAFDLQPDGSLTNRREWATCEHGIPDGCCLDAEGAIWYASPVSDECVRIAEGGRVLDRVAVTNHAYACMLGGPDRRTLFIATSASDHPEHSRNPRTGAIEITTVDVPGAGLP
jgi:sugar lactone lactonase YvrE